MKLILKILAIPIIVILSVMNFVIDLIMRVYCFGAGIILNALIVCIILAILWAQWQNLGIFIGIAVLGILATLAFVFLAAQVENVRMYLIDFLKA